MIVISKSEITKQLESDIYLSTHDGNGRVFGCLEVTVGYKKDNLNLGRIDYLTCDTKGIWRCYEIKSCKQDFYSNSKHTFVGHYNYYVMPKELYEQVKHDIPSHVGVSDGMYFLKNPKKQELGCDETILMKSMIRSLYRDNYNMHEESEYNHAQDLRNENNKLKKRNDKLNKTNETLRRQIDSEGKRSNIIPFVKYTKKQAIDMLNKQLKTKDDIYKMLDKFGIEYNKNRNRKTLIDLLYSEIVEDYSIFVTAVKKNKRKRH